MGDILIRGMEMPKNCCECLLAKLSPTGESIVCNYTLSTVPWDGLADDCPLVHVPPRGRLIDADKIYDAVEQRYRISSGEEHRCERDLLDLICSTPTVIPAEGGGK